MPKQLNQLKPSRCIGTTRLDVGEGHAKNAAKVARVKVEGQRTIASSSLFLSSFQGWKGGMCYMKRV